MKNPFKRFRAKSEKTDIPPQVQPQPEETPPVPTEPEPPSKPEPSDSFVEWRRSQIRGGIERRERNDIYEAYSVYGTDGEGHLICRYYHHYPEYERDFSMTYSRELRFDEFNRRLLAELDRGDVKLSAYNDCIEKARALTGAPVGDQPAYNGFSEEETAVLRAFCEAADTLADREYRCSDGVFYCGCRSVVGDEALHLRFRKPLPHDALYHDVSGVDRKPVEPYDVDNLWIMGVCNRLKEHSESCRITLLTSAWSLQKESVYLIEAKGFEGIGGTLLAAVADEGAFPRFGFYALDFSKK